MWTNKQRNQLHPAEYEILANAFKEKNRIGKHQDEGPQWMPRNVRLWRHKLDERDLENCKLAVWRHKSIDPSIPH